MKNNLLPKFILLYTLYSILYTSLCGCQNQQLYKDTQLMMGTTVEVISPDKKAAGIVFTEIKRIEDLLSIYREDSEISKLNRIGKLNASPETFYIIKKAGKFWLISEGAFDITIGPLMDIWGFTDKEYKFPQEEEIQKTKNLVGFDKIVFNNIQNVIEFKIQGMKIDLGAIAKGYAVDCAVSKLRENKIKSCLINAGGDIYCLGDKFGKPWNVAVQNPRGPDFLGYLELKDKAAATSGDYEQYFIKDNKRYSHILNPKTGYPADSGVVSVTVIAPDCLTADALATSIFVLGEEKGEALAKKIPDVKVNIVEEKSGTVLVPK